MKSNFKILSCLIYIYYMQPYLNLLFMLQDKQSTIYELLIFEQPIV